MNTYLKLIFILTLSLFIFSCASTYNMKDGGESFWGGGYLIEPVSDGVFRIVAKTNVAQWSDYGTARRMWKKHAEEVCKGKPYTEMEVEEYEYEKRVEPRLTIESWLFRYIVTVKTGLAVCSEE